MTVLKEISLPITQYFAPGVDIASQVEIDQIAELYSVRHNMHIVPLGSNTRVTPRETVYVVAHGAASGTFTKMGLPQLRECLRNHGVADGQRVVLAGCFTRVAAVGGLPTGDFQVRVSGFEGVLNVVENDMMDLVNDAASGDAHSDNNRFLVQLWKQSVLRVGVAMQTLLKQLDKLNANEVRDYFDSGMFDGVLALRPIKFGNGESGASALGILKSWLENTSKTSAANALWPEVFKAMSTLARFNDYLVFDLNTSKGLGTGKAALLAFARAVDEEHTRLFIESERRQACYQAGIADNLKRYELDPSVH